MGAQQGGLPTKALTPRWLAVIAVRGDPENGPVELERAAVDAYVEFTRSNQASRQKGTYPFGQLP